MAFLVVSAGFARWPRGKAGGKAVVVVMILPARLGEAKQNTPFVAKRKFSHYKKKFTRWIVNLSVPHKL